MDRPARIVAGKGKDMTQENIIRMARECFADPDGSLALLTPELTEFAALVAAAERENVAHWMRSLGYATGHGDTIEDLLDHLGTQIAEGLYVQGLFSRTMERAACADICDQHASVEGIAQRCAEQIRARNKT
jgi:uncharacterized protein YcbX